MNPLLSAPDNRQPLRSRGRPSSRTHADLCLDVFPVALSSSHASRCVPRPSQTISSRVKFNADFSSISDQVARHRARKFPAAPTYRPCAPTANVHRRLPPSSLPPHDDVFAIAQLRLHKRRPVVNSCPSKVAKLRYAFVVLAPLEIRCSWSQRSAVIQHTL